MRRERGADPLDAPVMKTFRLSDLTAGDGAYRRRSSRARLTSWSTT